MRAPGRRAERGQSLTEMAISFVVLVVVLAVGVDLGRLFFSMISLREAAEEGALYGSFSPADTTGIISRVRSSSTTPINLADTSVVSVAVATPGGACAGNRLTVTITYQFRLTMPFVGAIIGTQTVPITTASTSTILRPPTC